MYLINDKTTQETLQHSIEPLFPKLQIMAPQAPVSYVSPRARFGLILPATNTVVEAEFNWMTVPGVSWHSGRIEISNPNLNDDETMLKFLEQLRETIGGAVDRVCSCLPTYLVMGMSAETFWGGQQGAQEFEQFMVEKSGGLKVTTGALAAKAALDSYGAKKIGIITPYQAVGDQQVSFLSIRAQIEHVSNDYRLSTSLLRWATQSTRSKVSVATQQPQLLRSILTP